MGRGRELRPVHEKEMGLHLQTESKQTAIPGVTPVRGTLLQRKCACGGTGELAGECEECRKKRFIGSSKAGTLQRAAARDGREQFDGVPPIVHEVLHSPGQPLDAATRAFFEPRFGHDFSKVRIHTDARAAESARAVNALAYTVGEDVVFARDNYVPATENGQKLLAHELVHTVQQSQFPLASGEGLHISEPSETSEREAEAAAAHLAACGQLDASTTRLPHVARAEAEEKPGLLTRAKTSIYEALIKTMRESQRLQLALLRSSAKLLPPALQGPIETIADVVEVISDICISLVLAIVSVVGGIITGLVDMVKGVFRLAAGLLTGVMLLISGIVEGDFGPAKLWLDDVVKAIVGIPAALKALAKDWLDRFNKASTDQQTIMIGELTGQIIALLIPFAWAGRAGSASRLAAVSEEAGTAAGRTGAAGEVVDLAAVRAARAAAAAPSAAPVASASGEAALSTEGSLALKATPGIVEAPVPAEVIPFPVPVKAPALIPAGVPASAAAKTATVVGVAGATGMAAEKIAKAPKPKPKPPKKKKPCSTDPCPYELPIRWPTEFLPLPEFARPIIRITAGDRVWEGTDRGGEQRRFAEEINRNRAARIPPPHPCFLEDDDPNALYDAHHIHPLFLGGEDAEYNLCALDFYRHGPGHVMMNDQTEFLPEYEECGICTGYLPRHPAGQMYYVVNE